MRQKHSCVGRLRVNISKEKKNEKTSKKRGKSTLGAETFFEEKEGGKASKAPQSLQISNVHSKRNKSPSSYLAKFIRTIRNYKLCLMTPQTFSLEVSSSPSHAFKQSALTSPQRTCSLSGLHLETKAVRRIKRPAIAEEKASLRRVRMFRRYPTSCFGVHAGLFLLHRVACLVRT